MNPANAPTTVGNLRLQAGSPAIDVGLNNAVANVSTDLDGNFRIVNNTVDLGAFEFGSSPPPPDLVLMTQLNVDGTLDPGDSFGLTVALTNTTENDETDLMVTVTVPTSFTISADESVQMAQGAQQITRTIASLAVGASTQLNYTVMVGTDVAEGTLFTADVVVAGATLEDGPVDTRTSITIGEVGLYNPQILVGP